mmetsp:Transcript_39787/g.40564  ORF Transcript_39787/g.40564 Transcript_39787/m.40564 type:complete len:94 (+) Transcript_39787:441-722(+)
MIWRVIHTALKAAVSWSLSISLYHKERFTALGDPQTIDLCLKSTRDKLVTAAHTALDSILNALWCRSEDLDTLSEMSESCDLSLSLSLSCCNQ